ncbi:MAG: cupin domain-containing protein [Gemmatimonadota bacterium]
MNANPRQALVLENVHTGERIQLQRRPGARGEVLEMVGSIPAGRASMAVHEHRGEDLAVSVRSGTLSALVDDARVKVGPGQSLTIARRTSYRFWNEGPEPLAYEAMVDPVVDMDLYLEALFQVINASPKDRPSLTYLAKVMLAHRRTQLVRLLSRPVQDPLFWGTVLVGTLTGRYRGGDWPGAPGRIGGAPTVTDGPV